MPHVSAVKVPRRRTPGQYTVPEIQARCYEALAYLPTVGAEVGCQMQHKDHYPIALQPGLRTPKGGYDLLPVNWALMGWGGEGRRGAEEGKGGGRSSEPPAAMLPAVQGMATC